ICGSVLELAVLPDVAKRTCGSPAGKQLSRQRGRLMQNGGRCFALVGDAFGGRGGIAQYNRDFLSALADSGLVSSISILPRRAPDPFSLRSGISQAAPHLGRIGYIQAALRGMLERPLDMVFCGHLYMAPLALL